MVPISQIIARYDSHYDVQLAPYNLMFDTKIGAVATCSAVLQCTCMLMQALQRQHLTMLGDTVVDKLLRLEVYEDASALRLSLLHR